MGKILDAINKVRANGHIITDTYKYTKVLKLRLLSQDTTDSSSSWGVTIRSKSIEDAVVKLSDHFRLSPCNHSHDCCGCYYAYIVDAKRTKKKEFFFKINQTQNI